MNDIKLDSFPSNATEALTMLYLQKQDLSNTSPEDLAELYWETYFRIRYAYADSKSAGQEKAKSIKK